jgi:hypothetical protein
MSSSITGEALVLLISTGMEIGCPALGRQEVEKVCVGWEKGPRVKDSLGEIGVVLKNLGVGENENGEAGLKRENELSPPAKSQWTKNFLIPANNPWS